MKFYTSYYYQIRNFPTNLIGLSTAIFPPKYIKLGYKDKRGVWVIDCPPFKPGPQCEGLCNGKCNPKHPDDCKFLEAYRNQLDDIDVGDFLDHLEKLAKKFEENEGLHNIDFALLVYEAPSNPCSERIAIQGWGGMTGLEIREWQK